jgi:hypothetical protein
MDIYKGLVKTWMLDVLTTEIVARQSIAYVTYVNLLIPQCVYTLEYHTCKDVIWNMKNVYSFVSKVKQVDHNKKTSLL